MDTSGLTKGEHGVGETTKKKSVEEENEALRKELRRLANKRKRTSNKFGAAISSSKGYITAKGAKYGQHQIPKELQGEKLQSGKLETDFERLTQAHEKVQQDNALLHDEQIRADGKQVADAKMAAASHKTELSSWDSSQLRRLQQENERLKTERQKERNTQLSSTSHKTQQDQSGANAAHRRSLSHITSGQGDAISDDNSALLAQNRQLEAKVEGSKHKVAILKTL
ncbi:hypothetical protein HDV00_000567 [Rhizophlyctis rosea]|nr:hypothetical protein HDV00_000567 [Rhizophlyctis rosea]